MGLSREQAEACGIDWETGRLKSDAAKVAAEPAKRKPAKVAGEMNELERRFADDWLVGQPSIRGWAYEEQTLELSPTCRYTPDFTAEYADGSIVHFEVKGPHAWEDSILKVKWAADKFRDATFKLARWDKRRGRWDVRTVV